MSEDDPIVLTKDNREFLRNKLKATGMSPKRLFAYRDDLPEKFDWKNIHTLLSDRRKTLRAGIYNYIAMVCDENKEQGYQEITQDLLDTIQGEINRTGVLINQLEFKAKIRGLPMVRSNVVKSWFNGKVKKADKDAIEIVLNFYKQFPDRG